MRPSEPRCEVGSYAGKSPIRTGEKSPAGTVNVDAHHIGPEVPSNIAGHGSH